MLGKELYKVFPYGNFENYLRENVGVSLMRSIFENCTKTKHNGIFVNKETFGNRYDSIFVNKEMYGNVKLILFNAKQNLPVRK